MAKHWSSSQAVAMQPMGRCCPIVMSPYAINCVQLGRANQAVDRRGPFSAGIGSRKQIVLPSQSHSPQRPFGGVVIDLYPAIFTVVQQGTPASECIADGDCNLRLARDGGQGSLQPVTECFQ